MQLPRLQPVQYIEIKKPRWKQRVVGIASYRVGTHNQINIIAKDKTGKLYYPNDYYMSGEDIKKYDKQTLGSGVVLHLVPISDLEILERI